MLNLNMLSLILVGCAAGLLASKAGAQTVNALSAEETQYGYDLLFNGTNLATNWHAYRQTAITDAWTVKTDAPLGVRIQNQSGTRRPILTNKPYKNFDVKIDVFTTNNGNSGIFTRYEEKALDSDNARSGPEFQICGPSNGDCGTATRHYGSCYDMFGVNPALRGTWATPGGWSQVRIVAFEGDYVHYGNGKKLLEYKIGSTEFMTAYNRSKYASDGNGGRYYDIHPGGILLQHHGETGMAFRNLKAKELTEHPLKTDFKDGKWPDQLPQDFVMKGSSIGVKLTAGKSEWIGVEAGGPGERIVRVPFEHAGFKAVGVDGRSVSFRKISDGVYSMSRGSDASGLVIVSVTAGKQALTKIVSLQ